MDFKKVSMGNKLFFAPVKSPKRVLDLGTGTGVWATELGDEYPDADVSASLKSPTIELRLTLDDLDLRQ